MLDDARPFRCEVCDKRPRFAVSVHRGSKQKLACGRHLTWIVESIDSLFVTVERI